MTAPRESVRARVRTCAEALDEIGAPWAAFVDVARLDMRSCDGGELRDLLREGSGFLLDVNDQLGVPTEVVARLALEEQMGFRPICDDSRHAWAELTRAWTEAIVERRRALLERWGREILDLGDREAVEAAPGSVPGLEWRQEGPDGAWRGHLGSLIPLCVEPNGDGTWSWWGVYGGVRIAPQQGSPSPEAGMVAADHWLAERIDAARGAA